jgi:hypothetical protein
MGLMGIEVPEVYGGVAHVHGRPRHPRSWPGGRVGRHLRRVQNTLVNNGLIRGQRRPEAALPPRMCTDLQGRFALSEPAAAPTFALECRPGTRVPEELAAVLDLAPRPGCSSCSPTPLCKGYKGITAFIVERDFEGFAVGKKENKLGIRASSTVELILEGCKVPKENVLGPVGQGYRISIETLNEGRIGIGAQMIGVATGALEAAKAYVKERKQFGKPIAEFQGIQFQVAQAATELQAARLMVYNATRLKDAGLPFAEEAAMAKLFSSQVANQVCAVAVELFGGYGYSREYPVEKFYRDAKIGTIYEGTSNMQLQTIAKLLLK